MKNLVEVRGLSKTFFRSQRRSADGSGSVRAVDDVDLALREGECLALVGESGSGKSTLGRCIMALEEPDEGEILFDGEDLASLQGAALRSRRRWFQMVFQDPVASLDPRWRVGESLAEPLEIHDIGSSQGRRERVRELLELVGVTTAAADSYPHELSGGQRQRVALARALATEPRLLVADEAVSALDASLRGQILNLILDLRQSFGLTILFIAHDLAVVEQIADRVAVMYAGKIVELASTDRVYGSPQHPYTVSLLSAALAAVENGGGERTVLEGEPPDPTDLPGGCRFHPRCPIAEERCQRDEPGLSRVEGEHWASCHFPGAMRGVSGNR